MRFWLPHTRTGQVVGLLGGSFDPPHAGHVHISAQALRRFNLDQVWWLVSPGNPLKSRGPAPLKQRMQASQSLVHHPRVHVTDFEAQAGTRYTAQTLAALQRARPGVRCVWLMGADNLTQFHLWQDWQTIIENVPVGVLARPGQRLPARMSRTAKLYAPYRIPGRWSHLLKTSPAPAWCFVNMPMVAQSSTAIRAAGQWTR